ncbi:peptide deformylase [Gudongella sp. DL1XJH-153]|uniref:peptide deformylase n=1 Tax=Gudongella sp. DL1XJH-153 TaxID=3409804 RepID=UPI003BB74A23
MALRKIRLDGDPILRKKSREVAELDDRILQLLDDMVETMRHENGIGLAAPQIGVLKRVITIDIGEKPIIAINPVIEAQEGEVDGIEGCLSVPDLAGTVERPQTITISFMDENGQKVEMKPSGYLARVFCHEIDHLEGVLYTDKAKEVHENVAEDEELS